MMQTKNADGRTRVVVVDDGKGLGRAAIEKALKEAGHEVVGAEGIPLTPRPEMPILADLEPQRDPMAEFAAQVAAMPEEVPDPDLKQMPPFTIPNRSRAEKVVGRIYGTGARLRFPKKENAGSVQVVLQAGGKCTVLRQAATLEALLAEPVESFVKGGKDLQDTENRIKLLEHPVTEFLGGRKVTSSSILLGEMAWRALSQFPEFKVKRQREYDKYRKELQKRAVPQTLPDLAADAQKQLDALEAA